MDDAKFLAAFEAGTLEEDFTHQAHLRMAWLVLRADGPEPGHQRILDGLRRFTAAKGVAAKFHYTLTLFWSHMVAVALRTRPPEEGFEAFLAACPHLASSALPFEYYDRERLMSAEARAEWVNPERKRLP